MRYPTLAAAILTAATFALHVWGGGPEFNQPLQASALPAELRAVSGVLWHAVSLELAVFAAALVWLARNPHLPMSVMLAAIQLGFAGLFLWYGHALLDSIWVLPQWTIFLTLTALILWGSREKRRRTG